MIRPLALCVAVLSILLSLGCSTLPEQVTPEDAETARCEERLLAIDAAIASAGVRDGGTARIPGFPYLRTDRSLADLRDEPMDQRQADWWIDQLRSLDSKARRFELANLPPRALTTPDAPPSGSAALAEDIDTCARALLRRDFATSEALTTLRGRVAVPDEYQGWKRVLGLYPLTALAFYRGVLAYQAEARDVLSTPVEQLPVDGMIVRYAPTAAPVPTADRLRESLDRARRTPLGIPTPEGAVLARLYSAYAPLIEVDQVDRNDLIGRPTWDGGDRPVVDTSRPVLFVRTAHTRFAGDTLLQLVYSVWFPARPRTGTVDLLGGHMDGITWRVTLDKDGYPLLFDGMHNCGCYHMAFPTDRLRAREAKGALEEPLLVGPPLPSRAPPHRIALRVASGSHYIQNVRYEGEATLTPSRRFTIASDDSLRSLEADDGMRRSLFRTDGIVPGTERGERFFFWPMGVPSPGAMRQWGRHATAFVGQRHFDDPDLIDRYFERRFQ